MSPDPFARYSDRIMSVVKQLHEIHIVGVNFNNALYADNTMLIADSEANLLMTY